MKKQIPTCTLNFHKVPTSTPGIGPKWFGGTTLHTLCLPTQAIPCNYVKLWLKHQFIYIYIHYIHLLILLMIECVDLKLRSNNLLVCCITLPQSLLVWLVEEAILDFFLLSFNFSPAFTISFSSFLQLGQYLKYGKTYYFFF